MTLTTKFKAPRRTAIAAIIVVIMAAGAAFALLRGWGVFMGNTISTGSASLAVSTDGVHYGPAVPGFSFNNLIPGGYPAPADGNPLYLKNNGSSDVDLSFTLNDPPSDSDPDDLNNVKILLTDISGHMSPKSFTLGSLVNDSQTIEGDLLPGETRQYKLQVQATDDAQPGMTIGNVDLAFVGTARDPNNPN